MQLIHNLIEWTKETFQPLGATGLFIVAFMEASFFPIPPDVLLVVLCLASPEKSLLYALIASIGSVIGGAFGYSIGYFSEEAVVSKFIAKKKLIKAHRFFEKYGYSAILIAAFTPIPYKIFTISAGLFYISFKKFITASIVGRSLRFFIVAVLIMLFGEQIISFIESYFNILTLAFAIASLIGYLAYRKYKKSSRKKGLKKRNS